MLQQPQNKSYFLLLNTTSSFSIGATRGAFHLFMEKFSSVRTFLALDKNGTHLLIKRVWGEVLPDKKVSF